MKSAGVKQHNLVKGGATYHIWILCTYSYCVS